MIHLPSFRGMVEGVHSFDDLSDDFEFCDSPNTAETAAAARFFVDHIDGGTVLPKSAIKPASMIDFIRCLWLVERTDQGEYLIRLWSTGCVELTGYEFTDKQVPRTGPVAKWLPVYDRVLEKSCPVIVRNHMIESELYEMTTEVITLPVRDFQTNTDFVLCVYGVVDTN